MYIKSPISDKINCNIKVFVARQYPSKVKHAETRDPYAPRMLEILLPRINFFVVCTFFVRIPTGHLKRDSAATLAQFRRNLGYNRYTACWASKIAI